MFGPGVIYNAVWVNQPSGGEYGGKSPILGVFHLAGVELVGPNPLLGYFLSVSPGGRCRGGSDLRLCFFKIHGSVLASFDQQSRSAPMSRRGRETVAHFNNEGHGKSIWAYVKAHMD